MTIKKNLRITVAVTLLLVGVAVMMVVCGGQTQPTVVVAIPEATVMPTTTSTPSPTPTETPEPLEPVQLVFEGKLEPGAIPDGPPGEIPYLFRVQGVDLYSLTQEERQTSIFPPLVNEKGDSRYDWGGTDDSNVVAVYIPPTAPLGKYVFAIKLPDGRGATITFEHEGAVSTATPTPSYRVRLRVVTTSDWTIVSLLDGAAWEQRVRISVSDEATNASLSPESIYLNQPLGRADSGGVVETVFELVVTDLDAGSTVEFEIARGHIGETRVEVINYVTPEPIVVAVFVWGGINDSPANCERFRLDADLLMSTAPSVYVAPTRTPTPQPTVVPTPQPTSTPTATPGLYADDSKLGALPPTATRPMECGGAAYSQVGGYLPTQLTGQKQQGWVRVRYYLPEGATEIVLGSGGTLGITVRGSASPADQTVEGSEVLAAFPDAQVSSDKTYWLPMIRILIPVQVQGALIADGQVYTVEWSFTLPAEAEYDILNTEGWRWSSFFQLPFRALGPLSLSLTFVSEGTKYSVGHGCATYPVGK